MAYYELYRRSTLGMTLTDSLDEMVTNGKLTPTVAMKVLAQFDKCMNEALKNVKTKTTFKRRGIFIPTDFVIMSGRLFSTTPHLTP